MHVIIYTLGVTDLIVYAPTRPCRSYDERRSTEDQILCSLSEVGSEIEPIASIALSMLAPPEVLLNWQTVWSSRGCRPSPR